MRPAVIKRYLFLLITLLIFLAIIILAVREVLKEEWVKLYLINRVAEATKKDVRIGEVRFAFFPELSITGEGLEIFEEDGFQFLSSPRVTIKLGLLSLLFRRPIISSLFLESPLVFIKRDEEGRINVLKDLPDGGKGIPIPVKKVSIRDGRIFFEDQRVTPSHSIEMERVNILIDTPFFGEGLSFNIRGMIGREGGFGGVDFKGRLKQKKGNAEDIELSLEGSFDSLNTALFTPYVEGQGVTALRGLLDGEIVLTGGLKSGFLSGSITSREMGFSFKPYYPEPLNPKGINLLFALNYWEGGFYLKELDGGFDDVRLSGNLRVDYKRKEVEGAFKSSELTPSWLSTYIPALKGWNLGIFLQYIKGGTVELEEVSFKGGFDDFLSRDTFPLKARIRLKDIGIQFAKNYPSVKSLTGRIELTGDTFTFKGMKGVYGETVLNELSGTIGSAFTPNPEIDLMVRSSINLGEVEPLLATFYPQGKEWIKGLKDLAGRVDVNLRINKTIGREELGLKGEASLKEAGFFYTPNALKMSGIKGRFSFTPTDISIEEVRGLSGSSPFSLKGSIKGYNSKEPSLEIRVEYSLFAKDIPSFIPFSIPKGMKMDGKASGELLLLGKQSSITIKGIMNLTGMEYGFLETFHKTKGIPNRMNFQGRYLKGGRISNLLLILNLMDEELRLKGNLRDIKKLDGDLDIDLGEVNLARLEKVLPLTREYSHSGTVSGRISFKGSLTDWKGMKTLGEIKILNTSFILSPDSPPIKNLTLTIKLKEDRLEVPYLYLKKGESLIEGSLTIRGFKKPKVNFNLSAPLWRKKDFPPNERIKRFVEAFVKGGSVKGSLGVEKGELDGVSFQSLKASVSMEEGVWRIAPLDVSLQEGLFKGEISITPLKEGKNRYTMEIEWVGGDIEKVLKEWLEKERIMTGRFNAKAALLWEGGNKEEYLRSLSGSITTEFEKGRIYRLFTILSKLLGLLNPLRVVTLDLPSFTKQGMEYKKAQGVFKLERGVLSTKNLVIDGKEIRILWVGKVDIPDHTIDSVMAVQPFETVDKILEKTVGKIPLIGEIIIGKDKKLFVLYYKVEGDLEDPDVRGIQVESIGKGILERFKMLLPIR